MHMHFLLHYAHEVPAMQAACKAKERLERQQRREARRNRRERRKKKKTIVNDDGEEEEVTDEDAEDEDIDPEDMDDDEEEEEEEEPQSQVKQAIRSGPYAMCRKARLAGFAKRFGLSPEQFGENLRDNYQRHEVEQESTEPAVLAKEYLSA